MRLVIFINDFMGILRNDLPLKWNVIKMHNEPSRYTLLRNKKSKIQPALATGQRPFGV
jgi:hypothetical protein